MPHEFKQIQWDAELAEECRALVRRAMAEDLGDRGDLTTLALVPAERRGRAAIVNREPMVVAGMFAVADVLAEYDGEAILVAHAADGDSLASPMAIAEMEGAARTLLSAERVLLNILGRLSGIATLTRQYVDAVAGTDARIYDTRKTTPGWRTLEKYAVGCGGGMNHRMGLYDAVMIKDNHLAFGAADDSARYSPREAVEKVQRFYQDAPFFADLIVEVEVDTLEQFESVLPAGPDIVLLDNMPPNLLARAVAQRDQHAPDVQLEASGGITIDNVRAIALSGVDRISIGALTHSARCVDIGLDWL